MAQRVRLTWDRNQDDETVEYRIFRSESPEIHEQNRLEYMVMKVKHPTHINPVKVEDELLDRFSPRTYLLAHKNILIDFNGETYPVEVEINGVPTYDFTIDTIEGHILFDFDLPHTARVVAKQYTFDGVRAWDYAITEIHKNYYGPEARDNSAPSSPGDLVMDRDYDKNRVVLRWSPSNPLGKRYYYRIDAAIDASRHSGLSQYQTAQLREPLADRAYTIERSRDGVEWKEIAKIKGTVFYEYMVDREAPDPIRNFKGESFLFPNRGTAQITLNWSRVQDSTFSETSLYRVRAVNRVGAVSDPSNTVGPIPFKVDLKEIVIRRKPNDGTLPTFDGDDAVTVATINNLTETSYIEDVPDNNEYVYGIWVLDQAGNRSPLSYTVVEIGDATPPARPLDLSAEAFPLVVG